MIEINVADYFNMYWKSKYWTNSLILNTRQWFSFFEKNLSSSHNKFNFYGHKCHIANILGAIYICHYISFYAFVRLMPFCTFLHHQKWVCMLFVSGRFNYTYLMLQNAFSKTSALIFFHLKISIEIMKLN